MLDSEYSVIKSDVIKSSDGTYISNSTLVDLTSNIMKKSIKYVFLWCHALSMTCDYFTLWSCPLNYILLVAIKTDFLAMRPI